MKALYFEEPADHFSCVERAWRDRLDGSEEPAVFLRSRPGNWSGQPLCWSIKYTLEGRSAIEINGQWCEVFEGFCFVVPEQAAYRSTIRDAKALSLFGRVLADAPAEPELAIWGVFELGADEIHSLARRVDALTRGGRGQVGSQPDQGTEVVIDQPFPLPRSWRRTHRAMRRWLNGSAPRRRTAERLLHARHFIAAGFREHDICSRAAVVANMTRSHFSRQFSALFGQSPREFLVGYRSAVARSLLASGRHSVEQVATRVGYGHPSSLAHLFQRHRLGSPRSLFRRGGSS